MSNRPEPSSNFQKVFRTFVGPRRDWSVETVAERTGINVRTVRAHYGGESEPSWGKMLAYIDLLGPEFANALLAPVGMGGVCSLEAKDVCPRSHLSDSAARLSDLAKALEDGRVDHQEAARLAPDFRDHGIRCIEFAASLETDRVVSIRSLGKVR